MSFVKITVMQNKLLMIIYMLSLVFVTFNLGLKTQQTILFSDIVEKGMNYVQRKQ